MNQHAPIAASRAAALLSPGRGTNNPAIVSPTIGTPTACSVDAVLLMQTKIGNCGRG